MTTYNGTSGNDTFTITSASQIAPGDVYNGNGGYDTISLDTNTILSADFTGITLNGISAIVQSGISNGVANGVIPTKLTIAQLSALSKAVVDIQLADGGTIALSGKTIGPYIDLANANTTLDLTGAIAGSHNGIYPQFAYTIACGTGNYTLTGSNTDRSWFRLGTGNSTVHTGDGGAQVDGAGGLDKMYGGSGDDAFTMLASAPEQAGSVFDGGGGNNTLMIQAGSGFGQVDFTQYTIKNIQTIYGSQFQPTLINASQLAGVTDLEYNFTVLGTGAINLKGVFVDGTLSFGGSITAVDVSQANGGPQTGGVIGITLGNSGMTLTGGAVALNVKVTAAGAVSITGSQLNDTIVTGTGGDTVHAGAGDDRITVMGGAATVYGEDGNDSITINGGTVHVYGGAGDDAVSINGALGAGSVIDGGTGTNALSLSGYGVDISSATVTNFASLYSLYNSTVSAGTFAQFSDITGSFQLKGTTALSFAGKRVSDFLLWMDSAGGSVDFTGATISNQSNPVSPGVTVIGGTGGANTIIATDGADTITTSGLGDAIKAGGGDDHVAIAASQAAVTGSYDGGTGANTLTIYQASGTPGAVPTIDISAATITGFTTLIATSFGYTAPIVTLTIAQLEGFTTSLQTGLLTLADGGSLSLTGYQGATSSFQLSDSATTIDLRGFKQSFVTVTGGAGNDVIYGLASGNAMGGYGAFVDVLSGGGGNDTLVGSSGNDSLDGGSGTDTAVYTGQHTDYRITERADHSFQLADLRANAPDGIDQLVSIEHLQFADQTVDLTGTLSWSGDGNSFQLYSGQTLNLSNAATTGDTVSGDNGTITITNVKLTAHGNSQTITTNDDNAVITSTGAFDSLRLGGHNDTVSFGGNGQANIYTDTANFLANSGTVTVVDQSNVTILGSWLTVHAGSYDTVALGGALDAVTLDGGGSTVSLGTFSSATVNGGYDTVNVTGGGSAIRVNGQNTTVNSGSHGSAITLAAHLDVTVTGTFNAIALANGDTLNLTGSLNVVTAASGLAIVTLAGNSQNSAYGNRVDFTANTGQANLAANTTAEFTGNWLTLGAVDHDTLVSHGTLCSVTLWGSNSNLTVGAYNSVNIAGSGDSLVLTGGGGTVVVGGNGQAVPAASVDSVDFGSFGGFVHVTDISAVTIKGSWLDVTLGTNDNVTITGGVNQVGIGGNNTNLTVGGLSSVGMNGAADTVTVTGGGTVVTLSGVGMGPAFADTVNFGDNTGTVIVGAGYDVTINGSGIAITAAADDTLVLSGQNDTIAFAKAIGHATLTGFGAGDQVTLQKASFGTLAAGFDYWSYLLNHASTAAGDTTITLDANDTIVLKGYALAAGDQSKFSFA